jgi:MFS family permease
MLPRRSRIDPAVLTVLAEGFLSRLSFGIVSFALPLYAYHLGMGINEIGILVSLSVVSEMLLKPLLAPLVDRFGLRNSLSVAVGLRSLVALLLVFAHSPWQLYSIRLVHGISESVRDPSINAILAERGGKKTIASSFAWYNTAKVVAGAAGKAGAGVLITLTLSNYPLVFATAFVLSGLPFFVVLRYLKNEKIDGQNVRAEDATAPIIVKDDEPAPIQKRPAVFKYFILGALISGTAGMLNRLFPLLATQYAGLTEAQTGMIYGGSIVVLIFAGPLFGWLSDNVSRKLVLSARSIANTLSSILYIYLPSFSGILTAKIVDDMGKAAFRPAWGSLMAHISSFDRTRRARTMGYMSLAENIGETAGPLLAGILWSTWGVATVLVARAVIAIITEIYAIIVTRSTEEPAENEEAVESATAAGCCPTSRK